MTDVPRSTRPDAPPGHFVIRDGAHLVLHCTGWLLAQESSRRIGAPRWSEIRVWRLTNHEVMVARTGVSTVVHRPDCTLATPVMRAWIETEPVDMPPFFTLCTSCLPAATEMDPHNVLEVIRHRATLYPDADSAAADLLDGRPMKAAPRLVTTVLAQCARSDLGFAQTVKNMTRAAPRLV